MAVHARLKYEFTGGEKYHNLMTWLILSWFPCSWDCEQEDNQMSYTGHSRTRDSGVKGCLLAMYQETHTRCAGKCYIIKSFPHGWAGKAANL